MENNEFLIGTILFCRHLQRKLPGIGVFRINVFPKKAGSLSAGTFETKLYVKIYIK
jgi:hypothetical protein